VTYFRNDISDYIFRNPLSQDEFENRLPLYEGRFPNREIDFSAEEIEEFQLIEFVSADSVLQGIEAHSDVQVGGGIAIEVGADYVRGTLKENDDPLPRIPPFRVRLGARYQRNAFQAGGEVIAVAKQERLFGAETPTDGYGLLKLFTAYTFGTDRVANTITFRVDNLTNELYRNHLSLLKEVVPEMGRNFKLLYNVRF
jgi:iron complex outermembrane receptor protein